MESSANNGATFGSVFEILAASGIVVGVGTTASPPILLGIEVAGLDAMAARLGMQTLMRYGSSWREALMAAVANPAQRIAVSLDGVVGTSPRAMLNGLAAAGMGSRATAFQLEIATLMMNGRLGSATLYLGGLQIPNPFAK